MDGTDFELMISKELVDAFERGKAEGLAEAQRWISVKDKRPTDHQLVVARQSDVAFPVVAGYYKGDFIVAGTTSILLAVTDWLPLPPPPKEGKE